MHMAAWRNTTTEEEGQGQRLQLKFHNLQRVKTIPEGFRLASVKDVSSDAAKQQLREQDVISTSEIVRLSDGFIEGRNLDPIPRFKPGLSYKLAINRSSGWRKRGLLDYLGKTITNRLLSVRTRTGEDDEESWIREMLYDCEEGYASSLTSTEFRDVVAALLRHPSLGPSQALPVDKETGWTALHSACMNDDPYFLRDVVMPELRNNTGMLEHLINRKTSEDVEILQGKQWTPLHVAVVWGKSRSVKMVQLLLDNGADPNILDGNNMTPFLLGVQRGRCLPLVVPLLQSMVTDDGHLTNDLVKSQLKNALQYIFTDRNEFYRGNNRENRSRMRRHAFFMRRIQLIIRNIDPDRKVIKDLLDKILLQFCPEDRIDMYGLMRSVMENGHKESLDVLLLFLPKLSRERRLSRLTDEKGLTLLHHAVYLIRSFYPDIIINQYIKPLLTYSTDSSCDQEKDRQQEAYDLFWAENEKSQIAFEYAREGFKREGFKEVQEAQDEVEEALVKDWLCVVDGVNERETSLQKAARLRKVQLFRRLLDRIVDGRLPRGADDGGFQMYTEMRRRQIFKQMFYDDRYNVDDGDVQMSRRDVEERVLNEQLEDDERWKQNLKDEEKANVREVRKSRRFETILQDIDEVEQHVKQATDQATTNDILGKRPLADALAALVLNPYVGTPLTIGIYGDWGIGKSSLMLQMEICLFQIAIEQMLTLAKSFPQLKKILHERKYGKLIDCVIESLLPQDKVKFRHFKTYDHYEMKRLLKGSDSDVTWTTIKMECILKYFCSKYNEKYHSIYKSLALFDISKLTDENDDNDEDDGGGTRRSRIVRTWRSFRKFVTQTRPRNPTRPKNKSVSAPKLSTPSILTVHYNAWQYQDENQALAGLANEVSKEIERAMNTAQWISMCWCNSMNDRHHGRPPILFFCSSLFILAFTGVATWLAWVLLSSSSNSDLRTLKYGSVPLSIFAIFWAVLQQVYSFIQPVSKSLKTMFSPINHQRNLGYHQQVVEDIRFLMQELRRPPSWIWRFVAVFVNIIGENRDYVAGTKIPKPIPSEKLRVVVFVDDLDRCTDDTILQVLTSINLVLSVCEFNVVVGVDKSVIIRTIRNKFAEKTVQLLSVPNRVGDRSEELTVSLNSSDPENIGRTWLPAAHPAAGESPEDLAEKFLEKIVQLPVVLPDPGHKKVGEFLEGQMGFRDRNPRTRSRTQLRKRISVSTERSTDSDTESPNDDQNEETDFEDGGVDRSILFARYTAHECEIFKDLQKCTKGEARHPREWKRLLNYHRLAYNVVSQNEKAMEGIVDWKAELIVWVFVCWHWKELMNQIIQEWDFLCGKVENCRISLKAIVEVKEKEVKDNEPRTQRAKIGEWEKMIPALKINDVSMKGIEMFQDFRFQCKQSYLQSPANRHYDGDTCVVDKGDTSTKVSKALASSINDVQQEASLND